MFHEYELAVVVRPDIDEGQVKATLERIEGVFTQQGGTLLDREEWRKQKLAYTIENHLSGFFAFVQVLADPAHIEEVERRLRLDENVLRFLTVKRADSVDASVRIAEAAEIRKVREEEAARRLAEQEAAAAAAAEAEAKKQAAAEAAAATTPTES